MPLCGYALPPSHHGRIFTQSYFVLQVKNTWLNLLSHFFLISLFCNAQCSSIVTVKFYILSCLWNIFKREAKNVRLAQHLKEFFWVKFFGISEVWDQSGDKVSKNFKSCHICCIRWLFLTEYEKYGTLCICEQVINLVDNFSEELRFWTFPDIQWLKRSQFVNGPKSGASLKSSDY